MFDLLIREFSVQDLKACLDLLRVGHDQSFTRERFEWLHLNAPMSPSRIALAWQGRQLVGFYSVVRKPLCFKGSKLIGGRDIDPVVHPDFRGRGVFRQLLKYGVENFTDIDVFFNFANSASSPGFMRQGWQHVGMLEDRIFQVGVKGISLKQFVARILSLGTQISCYNRFASSTVRECSLESFAIYLQMSCFDSAAFVQVYRDSDWLNWRYLKKTDSNYRYFLESLDGLPQRLYIMKSIIDSEDLVLCDLLESNGGDVRFGFASLFSFLHQEKVLGKVIIWNSFYRSHLRQFIQKPLFRGGGVPFFIRQGQGREKCTDLFDLNNWLITPGDLEII